MDFFRLVYRATQEHLYAEFVLSYGRQDMRTRAPAGLMDQKEDNMIQSFRQATSLQSCFGKKGLSWTIHSFEKACLANGEARITAKPQVANLDQRRRSCR